MCAMIDEVLHLLIRWAHFVAGVLWLGLLWFIAFVHSQVAKTYDADSRRKVVPELVPRVLYLFRLGAIATWVTGVLLLGLVYYGGGAAAAPGQSKGLALGAGLGSMVVGWIVYDLLWKALASRERLGILVSLVLLVGTSFALDRVMSGRSLFIHLGAILGTIMQNNVLQRVWPNQRLILAAVKAGTAPPEEAVRVAALRLQHNTYLSVPLLFFMVSNHFPVAYGSGLCWLVAPLMVSSGGWPSRVSTAWRRARRPRGSDRPRPRMSAVTPPRAERRQWIGLAVLALPCVVYAMDFTVLNLAVPELSADLRPTSAQLLWIVDIYGFFVAGSLITMGSLGDRIGRRRLLLIGAAAFGVTSVLAAFSTSAGMLIVTRALLGVAGATLAPSTLSLIRNMFHDPRQRTLAIGVWVTSYSVGSAIGPVLGGVLLEYFWWGSVFLPGVPVMVLLLVLGPVLLPEFRDPAAGRLDLLSAGLSLTAVLTMIYGLKRTAEDGLGWWPALSIAVGLAVGIVFVRRQRTLADPLIDLRLFRAPAFSASLAAYTLAVFSALGVFLSIAQYMQLVLGLSPLEAGLWTLPSAGGFIAGSMLTPAIARRVRPAAVMAAGLAVAAAGFAMLTQVEVVSGLAVVVVATVVYALGLAPVVTLATDLIVGTAPPERAGAASAISETGAELGGALGIAILGSIGTAVYRRVMADALPAAVPAATREAAEGTLGGAVAVAAQLPAQLGAYLLGTARAAFVQGLELTAALCAAVALVTAVVVGLLLRHARPGAEREEQRDP